MTFVMEDSHHVHHIRIEVMVFNYVLSKLQDFLQDWLRVGYSIKIQNWSIKIGQLIECVHHSGGDCHKHLSTRTKKTVLPVAFLAILLDVEPTHRVIYKVIALRFARTLTRTMHAFVHSSHPRPPLLNAPCLLYIMPIINRCVSRYGTLH